MKFEDEELSAIMDAHESGKLQRQGTLTHGTCCILMVAAGTDMSSRGWAWAAWKDRYQGAENDVASWFDASYDTTWTTDEFLAQLEARGLA
jgi:hypothetical protein